jgi:hypothetical protein
MDAIDYSSAFGSGGLNPMQAFNQSLALGSNIMQQRAAAAQAEAARIAAQAEAERQAKLQEAMARLDRPDVTSEDYRRVSSYLPADQAKVMQDFATSMTEEERNAALAEQSGIFSALRVGHPEIARDRLSQLAAAARNSGDEQEAKSYDELLQIFDASPEGPKVLEQYLGLTLNAMPGGDKALEGILKYEIAPSEQMIKEAEAKYADARQAAELRKLDAETLKFLADAEKAKLPQGTEIDENARKIMNTAVETAISADLTASQAENLAEMYAKYRPASGYTAKGWEAVKRATGEEDIDTRLKQEYTKLRNTDVLKNLPPGVASDKDIEIALAAFPDTTANPDTIVAFLRGMAKLQRYASSVNKAKVEWVNQNGSLGPARLEFTAGGEQVKKGMGFWDFTKKIPMPNVVDATSGKAATASGAAAKPVADTKPAVKVDF